MINKTGIYIILLNTLFLSIGCDSENALECFKKTGRLSEKEIHLEPFNKIIVMDEADIYLQPGDEQQVAVKAGNNIIPGISFKVQDETLIITNQNKCLWVREPGNPGIYICCPDLRRIEVYDFANFYSTDTVQYSKLWIESDGTGNFDLKLNIDSLVVNSLYISNFNFAGTVDYFYLRLINDSQFKGKALISNTITIEHSGSNNVELFPVKILKGQINATGSIKYYHKPESIEVNIRGTGKLIDVSSEN